MEHRRRICWHGVRSHHPKQLQLNFRPIPIFSEGNQYIGKVREYGIELQEKYGVTEQEAINIVMENKTVDYARKYYKIKNLIPDFVDQQYICDTIKQEYLEMQYSAG